MLSQTSISRFPSPHLSVVAVSRNDDHGGDMLGRMQHFVDGFIAQCRKHHLKAELILVEWNPPDERPPLDQALDWPDDFGPAAVRIITVPPDVHAKFAHATALPLFQMIGKNAGIRRAHGRYVLATNVDILFDDAIVVYLRDHLKPGIVLRGDRYDVFANLPKGTQFDRVLAECRNGFFQVNTRFGIFNSRERRFLGMVDSIEARLIALYSEVRIFGPAHPVRRLFERLVRNLLNASKGFLRSLACGFTTCCLALKRVPIAFATAIRFMCFIGARVTSRLRLAYQRFLLSARRRGFTGIIRLMWRGSGRIISGLPQLLHRTLGALTRLLQKVVTVRQRLVQKFINLARNIASSQNSVLRACHLMGWPSLSWKRSPANTRLARSQRLHTNACGDFTLLARQDWFQLRGYPEWPIFSWYIDSVFMFAATAHGIKQIALGPKYRIFHIDHSRGSGWSLDGAADLFARLDRTGIPYLSDEDVSEIRKTFARDSSLAIVNDENWGLVNVALPEREVTPFSARILNANHRTDDVKYEVAGT